MHTIVMLEYIVCDSSVVEGGDESGGFLASFRSPGETAMYLTGLEESLLEDIFVLESKKEGAGEVPDGDGESGARTWTAEEFLDVFG
jgi:hypothetical protein